MMKEGDVPCMQREEAMPKVCCKTSMPVIPQIETDLFT